MQPQSGSSAANGQTEQQAAEQAAMFDVMAQQPSINTFSWLDLPAVGDFATQNNSIGSGSIDGFDRFDDSSMDGFNGFDQNFMNLAQQPMAWNGMSPTTGIIF
jgi:hypothetical protein